jgi:hypothetical protein
MTILRFCRLINIVNNFGCIGDLKTTWLALPKSCVDLKAKLQNHDQG